MAAQPWHGEWAAFGDSKCEPYTTSTDAGMSTNSEGGWWCSLKSTGVAPESDLWETVSLPKRNLRIVNARRYCTGAGNLRIL